MSWSGGIEVLICSVTYGKKQFCCVYVCCILYWDVWMSFRNWMSQFFLTKDLKNVLLAVVMQWAYSIFWHFCIGITPWLPSDLCSFLWLIVYHTLFSVLLSDFHGWFKWNHYVMTFSSILLMFICLASLWSIFFSCDGNVISAQLHCY